MSRTLSLRVANAGLPSIDMPTAVPEDPGVASRDRGTVQFVAREPRLDAALDRGTAPS